MEKLTNFAMFSCITFRGVKLGLQMMLHYFSFKVIFMLIQPTITLFATVRRRRLCESNRTCNFRDSIYFHWSRATQYAAIFLFDSFMLHKNEENRLISDISWAFTWKKVKRRRQAQNDLLHKAEHQGTPTGLMEIIYWLRYHVSSQAFVNSPCFSYDSPTRQYFVQPTFTARDITRGCPKQRGMKLWNYSLHGDLLDVTFHVICCKSNKPKCDYCTLTCL